MVRFGGDKLQKMFEKLGDEQVQSKAVTRSITMAQKRVEGFNFDMRKQLLDYDDVLRRQREIIYAQRNRILESDEVHEMVHTIFDKAIEETLQANIVDAKKQTVDPVSLSKSFDIMGMQEEKQIKPDEIEGKSYKEIEDYAKNKIWVNMKKKSSLLKNSSFHLKEPWFYVTLTETGLPISTVWIS